MSNETASQTVARLEGLGWSPSKILSGLGLPGFGKAHAAKAISAIKAGASPHDAAFGR
jgi:hypothetical protein